MDGLKKTYSLEDAFNLMKDFLDRYWENGGRSEEEIANLLSSLGAGGPVNFMPMDPALWEMWQEAARDLVLFEGREAGSLHE